MTLAVEPHPQLDLQAFVTEFSDPLGDLQSSSELLGLLDATSKLTPEFRSRAEALCRAAGCQTQIAFFGVLKSRGRAVGAFLLGRW